MTAFTNLDGGYEIGARIWDDDVVKATILFFVPNEEDDGGPCMAGDNDTMLREG